MTDQAIRMLILGTGNWARAHAAAYQAMDNVQVVGAVDTNGGRLAEFCTDNAIERPFATLDEALAWGQFEAASNVTPDPAHFATTMQLLEAGKHVLCEKPLALNHGDADTMTRAAKAAGVVNMIDLTYRRGPELQKAAQMVAEGQIGQVRHFEASYLQSWLTQPAWGDWRSLDTWLWRLSTAHGSAGVLGDVGVHVLDYATYIAGSDTAAISCKLTTFDKAPGNRIGQYTLDANDSCAMHLELENGATGVLHASRFASGHLNDLQMRIFGDKGALDARSTNHQSFLRGCLGEDLEQARWTDIGLADGTPNMFERFIAAIRGTGTQDPDFARGATLQKTLDRAFDSDAEQIVLKAV